MVRRALRLSTIDTYSLVRETAPYPACSPRTSRNLDEWGEEELSQVRMVLRKLTALRVENANDAEDLVQETLLTMTAKCPQIAIEKGLLIWGMGILRKKIGNYYRKTRRWVPLEEAHIGARNGGSRALVEPLQESVVHHGELRDLVGRVLKAMAPRERAAVELFLAGTPTHEIAQLLFPEKYQNIVNWLHRGRKKLARELARHGYK